MEVLNGKIIINDDFSTQILLFLETGSRITDSLSCETEHDPPREEGREVVQSGQEESMPRPRTASHPDTGPLLTARKVLLSHPGKIWLTPQKRTGE